MTRDDLLTIYQRRSRLPLPEGKALDDLVEGLWAVYGAAQWDEAHRAIDRSIERRQDLP